MGFDACIEEDAGLAFIIGGIDIFPMAMAFGTATGAGKKPSGGCGMVGPGTNAFPSGARAAAGLGPGMTICMSCDCVCAGCIVEMCWVVATGGAFGEAVRLSVPSAGPK